MSVPFPGILFLNVLNREQVFNQRFWSFRPLPGDLISHFVLTARTTEIFRIGFRPLPGDLISPVSYTHLDVYKRQDIRVILIVLWQVNDS